MASYSSIVWKHFQNPINVGSVENPDAKGFAGFPRAGRFMEFTARLVGAVIQEIRFRTYGCAPAIAAGSFLTEALEGKTLTEAATWDVKQLLDALGGLPSDKVHCAVLAIDALKNLVNEGKSSQSNAAEPNMAQESS